MNSWLGRFALWKCFPPFLSFKQLSTVPAFGMIDTALVGLNFVIEIFGHKPYAREVMESLGYFCTSYGQFMGPF